MRRWLIGVYIASAIATPNPSIAQQTDVRAKRQFTLDYMMSDRDIASIGRVRSVCLSGKQPKSITDRRAIGLDELPDASEYCIIALTRLGRMGALEFLREAGIVGMTPALAFDRGFVTAYRNREALSARLPTMAALKPSAERCLAQAERDTDLCFSVGYAYGVRAVNGEVVRAQ